ncbi:ornithine cyclodeaminase/alanine dehydrogenase-like protein (mu-crystallin family) [Bradyrhizobium sp. LB14.3]|uniref:hypothetical protein n=1 Tax=Bradyrhizobium sp. LB14.3 TaxID=3156328 RepID=UPI00339B4E66
MSRYFFAPEVDAGLDYRRLIDALSEAVRRGGEAMPVRQSYNVGTAASPGRLLTMLAWERGKALGLKLVTVFPKSGACVLPAFCSLYMLFDGNRPAARNDRWRNTH